MIWLKKIGDFFKYKYKPWLKRNYDEKEFILEVDYVINHLNDKAKKTVLIQYELLNEPDHYKKWRLDKIASVEKQLNEGKKPEEFKPIHIYLDENKEEFIINNGYSRLSTFKKKGIKKIKAIINAQYVYEE